MLSWFLNPLGALGDILSTVFSAFSSFLVFNPIFYTIFLLWILIVVARLIMEVIG